MFDKIPNWLGTALAGAVLAVLGYFGTSAFDWWQKKQAEQARTVAQLQSLQSLLMASRTLFDLQQEQADKLMDMLKKNHPTEYRDGLGYDDTLSRCYPVLNDGERELHGIVRAYTEHSLRKVNQAVSEWLRADAVFKTGVVKSSRQKELAEKLFALEIHLMLWHAKYESWIPGHPEHALVYMADEKAHGLGFPPGTDEVVGAVLAELR